MLVQLVARAETILLDREKKSRSFQNIDMTYKQVIQEVIGDYYFVDFDWRKVAVNIREPIIQYEETDWKFLQRLCSHFHSCLVERSNSRGAILSLGIERERQRQLKESEIIGLGIDKGYYENGCYEAGLPPGYSRYLVVKTKENWDIGDYIFFESNAYLLYEKHIIFQQGEIQFIYQLGMPGLLYRRKIFNRLLAGVSLRGMVRKTKGEQVYMQLDIDKQENADYPWKWVPYTSNISYCMPEIDTKIELYFPTDHEITGQAVLGKFDRSQSRYSYPQEREFTTIYQKKLGLFTEKLFLEGRDRAVSLSMEDIFGIEINSEIGIYFHAGNGIQLKGSRLFVSGSEEIICRTPVSNMELCQDINLFAPSGVHTISKEDKEEVEKEREDATRQGEECLSQGDDLQVAYTTLAAIPVIDFSLSQEANCVIEIVACAGIPRIATGQVTHTMMEVMDGKKINECSFPWVFKSMDNYTVKGGYLLPKEDKEK